MTLNSYTLNLEPTNTYKQIRSWEARTRHRRCRTRVRLGGTRRRAGDAAARASGRVGPRGSHVVFTDARRREPIRLRRAPTRADSGRLGPESAGTGRNCRYRPKQPIPAEIQKKKKKKKKPQNAPFSPKFKTHSSHYVSLTLSLC